MKSTYNHKVFPGLLCMLFAVIATLCTATTTVSDEFTDRRITAGAKIFRTLLAADVDIDGKKGSDDRLRLCLLYMNDTDNAERARITLLNRDDTRIRNIDVLVEVVDYYSFIKKPSLSLAGIFLTESLSNDKLEQIVKYAMPGHTIVFSPFEGDVERGVLSGIAVEARVRPYLNKPALDAAGIRLKSFFIRVAKIYE